MSDMSNRVPKHFRLLFVFSIFIVLLSIPALAQRQIYEPNRGGRERAALMDAIRKYDAKRDPRLSAEVFNVSALRVQGVWAYTMVEQQLRDGVVSYGVAHVFLRRVRGNWQVEFSTFNDGQKVGVDGLESLRKRYKTFPKQLADFAMNYLAG